MHTPVHNSQKAQTTPRPNCLDCVNCTGICRDVIDMVYVPQTVLHRSAVTV